MRSKDKCRFFVGQKVWLGNIYNDKRKQVEVIRVGRTLVQIDDHGHWTPFRIDTGYDNRDPSQQFIMTDAEATEQYDREALIKRLGVTGLQFKYHTANKSNAWLRRVVEAAEREDS